MTLNTIGTRRGGTACIAKAYLTLPLAFDVCDCVKWLLHTQGRGEVRIAKTAPRRLLSDFRFRSSSCSYPPTVSERRETLIFSFSEIQNPAMQVVTCIMQPCLRVDTLYMAHAVNVVANLDCCITNCGLSGRFVDLSCLNTPRQLHFTFCRIFIAHSALRKLCSWCNVTK